MKGNRIIATVATLVAGCAIGAGAAVTQGAMAQAPESEIGDKVTVVNFDDDGNGVECTFTGETGEVGEAGGVFATAVPLDEAALEPMVGAYTVEIADDGTVIVNGVPSDGAIVGETVIGEATTGGAGFTEFEVTAGDTDIVPAAPLPIEVGEVRAGTPEECSVILSGADADS